MLYCRHILWKTFTWLWLLGRLHLLNFEKFYFAIFIKHPTFIRQTRVGTWTHSNLLYIFGNLKSLSIWTWEVKSIAVFSVYYILSAMYLGLLHKTWNVCNQMSFTVYCSGDDSRCKILQVGSKHENCWW